MKYFPLILANLGRHKRRTILTISSVALALFLFASLQTVTTTIAAASRFGSARRLVSMNATGFVLPLPIAYANRLQAVPGVEQVTWANWFGGKYGDGKRFFAAFAIDPKSYLETYPEISVPEDQKRAFLAERSSALVGIRLKEVFGWQLGQNITLQGNIYPGDWTFTIRGFYNVTDPVINDDMMMFHHAYLEEKIGRPGQAGGYIVKIDDPANAPTIGKAIDDQFRNSSNATKPASSRSRGRSSASAGRSCSTSSRTSTPAASSPASTSRRGRCCSARASR